jgi:hypothetical protein
MENDAGGVFKVVGKFWWLPITGHRSFCDARDFLIQIERNWGMTTSYRMVNKACSNPILVLYRWQLYIDSRNPAQIRIPMVPSTIHISSHAAQT